MPKISELPAATTLSGSEVMSVVQSGVTKKVALTVGNVSLGSGFYNVRSYGATGDGATNDTAAIQAAIDAAGNAGGGVVFIPAGTYKVQPPTLTSDAAALYVDDNNITILGAGAQITKLKWYRYDGAASTTTPPLLLGGVVQRGHGFKVAASGVTRSYVSFRDFEFDGGAGNTGNSSLPANTTTGDGWDVSHKCIYLDHDQNITNITIDGCYLHAWRGEIIHYGGTGLDTVLIRDSKIGDSNADAISMSCSNLTVEQNKLYSCWNAAVENSYFNGYNVFRDNYFYDCHFGGLQVFPADQDFLNGMCDIHDNRFELCGAASTGVMYIQGARNTRVYNNLIIDCARGIYCISPGLGGDGLQSIGGDNIAIFNNRFVCKSVDITWCIGVYATVAGTPFKRLHVYDNQAVIMQTGVDAGRTITRMIEAGQSGWVGGFGVGCRFRNNEIMPGTLDNTQDAQTTFYALADTSAHDIATLNVAYVHVSRVSVSYRVYNGATTLTLQVIWTDTNNVTQTKTLVTGSQPVGNYHVMFELSPDGVPTTYGTVRVSAQAGTANNIALSAEISG